MPVMTYQKKFALIICPDMGTCMQVRWGLWQNIINSKVGGECRLLILDEPLYDPYLLYHTATVVFSRPTLDSHFPIIKEYAKLKKKYGFKLAVEMDDLLFSVQGRDVMPEWNPAPIDTVDVGRKYKENLVGIVDRWLVSTDCIAYCLCNEFGINPDSVDVLPNFCFSSAYWDEHKPTRKKKIDVFYTGSGCHYKEGNKGDLDGPWIEGIGLSMERGYINFHAFGDNPGILPRGTILHEQVFPGLWASTLSHYAPDVLIAPLQNVLFNKAKSNLKGLEAAAVGAAFVASVFPGSPYSKVTPQLTAVTKDTTPDDLMRMFDALRDPAVRKECVKTTRHAVAEAGLVAEMKQGTDRFIKTMFKGFLV